MKYKLSFSFISNNFIIIIINKQKNLISNILIIHEIIKKKQYTHCYNIFIMILSILSVEYFT